MTTAEIITALGMRPHPEGGWYVETFRDAPNGGRGYSTAIYFLLERGQASAWHRVKDAAEVWHLYAGAALLVSMRGDGGKVSEHRLGADIHVGERPQLLVPAGWWQTARSTGDWTLVGCTVAPGFDFAQFEMADPDRKP